MSDMSPAILNRCEQKELPTPHELQRRAINTWKERPLESMQLYKIVIEKLQSSNGCSDIQADVLRFPTYQYMDIEIDNYPDLHQEMQVIKAWLTEQAYFTAFWQKDQDTSILRICWDIRVLVKFLGLSMSCDNYLVAPCGDCKYRFDQRDCHGTCRRYRWTMILAGTMDS